MDLYPKLRALDFQPVLYEGQQMWFLRDPQRLSEIQLFVPISLAPLLGLIDGAHTVKEIHEEFCQFAGDEVPFDIVSDAIDQLDRACLLDNHRAKAALALQLNAFRAESCRPPSIAGHGYPSQPKELAEMLNGFDTEEKIEEGPPWLGRGIVSPHIDYQRGGTVYSRVWKRAADAIEAADLIIIFGTDHNGGPGKITLTRQPYATPYGLLPIDLDLVNRLANAIGNDFAFSDELHHRDEHSIELSAVWLHHIIKENSFSEKPMVPILVGSFQHFLVNGDHPQDDRRLNSFLQVLVEETNRRRVLAVASIDLAHIGPVFGDNFLIDDRIRAETQTSDQELIHAAIEGDAEKWFEQIAANDDRNRICGFAPTYLFLRFLGATQGTQVAYNQCPADPESHSMVSICGLLID